MGFTGISDDGYTLYGLGMQYPLKAVWDGYDEWKGGERRLMFENGTMLEEGQYWRVQY